MFCTLHLILEVDSPDFWMLSLRHKRCSFWEGPEKRPLKITSGVEVFKLFRKVSCPFRHFIFLDSSFGSCDEVYAKARRVQTYLAHVSCVYGSGLLPDEIRVALPIPLSAKHKFRGRLRVSERNQSQRSVVIVGCRLVALTIVLSFGSNFNQALVQFHIPTYLRHCRSVARLLLPHSC